LVFAGLILLAVAVVALAADAVTGNWVWESQGRGGGPGFKTTAKLKADGAKLTGTVSVPSFSGGPPEPGAPMQMEDAPISNGKVDGNNITFEVTRDIMGNSFTSKYAGVVAGSEMKLKITRPGFGGGDPTTTDVTAKKQ